MIDIPRNGPDEMKEDCSKRHEVSPCSLVSRNTDNSPLSHGGHIVPGDQKSFVLPRQASPPWFPLRALAW